MLLFDYLNEWEKRQISRYILQMIHSQHSLSLWSNGITPHLQRFFYCRCIIFFCVYFSFFSIRHHDDDTNRCIECNRSSFLYFILFIWIITLNLFNYILALKHVIMFFLLESVLMDCKWQCKLFSSAKRLEDDENRLFAYYLTLYKRRIM